MRFACGDMNEESMDSGRRFIGRDSFVDALVVVSAFAFVCDSFYLWFQRLSELLFSSF